jgi:hypothetical protein
MYVEYTIGHWQDSDGAFGVALGAKGRIAGGDRSRIIIMMTMMTTTIIITVRVGIARASWNEKWALGRERCGVGGDLRSAITCISIVAACNIANATAASSVPALHDLCTLDVLGTQTYNHINCQFLNCLLNIALLYLLLLLARDTFFLVFVFFVFFFIFFLF